MAQYRAVVRHVRYWRGNIHRWSTSYLFTGSGSTPDAGACTILKNADSAMCYNPTSPVAGGIYEVQFYNRAGGPPIVTQSYFAYGTPSAWIRYTSTGWGTIGTTPVESAAEVAMLCEWPAGISATGKPVFFRKWYHAVPQTSTEGATADIGSGVVTSLEAAALSLQTSLASGYGLQLGTSSRLAGTTPVVSPFYSNHQMPRGRRKKSVTVDGTSYRIKNTPVITSEPPVEED